MADSNKYWDKAQRAAGLRSGAEKGSLKDKIGRRIFNNNVNKSFDSYVKAFNAQNQAKEHAGKAITALIGAGALGTAAGVVGAVKGHNQRKEKQERKTLRR